MPKSTPKSSTTAQSLGALLKSARDIMRKDKGLNGDLDRLPMLTWIMFLKFLDDLEIQCEGEAKLAGKKFKPAIEPPYRWRDWAAKSDGITGDELLAFINNEETTLPNGKKGAGLFRYLQGGGYRANPLEVMAYDLQDYFEKNGQPIEVESFVRRQLDSLMPTFDRAFKGEL